MKKELESFYKDELILKIAEIIEENNQKKPQRNMIVITEHKQGISVATNESLVPYEKIFLLTFALHIVFEEEFAILDSDERTELIIKNLKKIENLKTRAVTEAEKNEI